MASRFGMLFGNRQVNRLPNNPHDISTIVNIFPKEIHEINYTLEPGTFHIPYGTYNNPGILQVGASSWWKDIDPEQPLIQIPVASITVAESVIRDYSNGMPWFTPTQRPGLFAVFGKYDDKNPEHKTLKDKAAEYQKNWFTFLVKQADMLWARTNGNPLAIADDMKLAARELGLEDKDWLRDQRTLEMIRCKACQQLIRKDSILCGNCKVVLDVAAFTKLGLKFAS